MTTGRGARVGYGAPWNLLRGAMISYFYRALGGFGRHYRSSFSSRTRPSVFLSASQLKVRETFWARLQFEPLEQRSLLAADFGDAGARYVASDTQDAVNLVASPALAIAQVTDPVFSGNVHAASASGTGTAGADITLVVADGTNSTRDYVTTVDVSGNWSISNIELSGLNDGAITYTVTATDAGNTTTDSSMASKDTAYPAMFVNPISEINIANPGPVKVTGTGEPGLGVSLFIAQRTRTLNFSSTILADGTWSISGIDVGIFTDGIISFTAAAEDAAGNRSQYAATTEKDTVAPTVDLLSVSNPITPGNASATTASGVGEVGARIWVVASDGTSSTAAKQTTVADNGNWSVSKIDVRALLDGIITYTVIAEDRVGNTATDSLTAVKTTIQSGDTTVAGRHVFYNNSFFDGNNPAIDAADDAAIDPSKSAYLPGSGQAQLENITNYSRGLNGIVIDLAGGGAHTAINANDFMFRVGANNSPDTWTAAPAHTAISVRPGAGANGSDRVVITWADNAIQNTYLQVQLLPTDRTGLAAPDVFYFGNLVGETAGATPQGDFARTIAADGGAILVTGTQLDVGISNRFDIDKSNSVTVADDRGPIIMSGTGSLARINIGADAEATATAHAITDANSNVTDLEDIGFAIATTSRPQPVEVTKASAAFGEPAAIRPVLHRTHRGGELLSTVARTEFIERAVESDFSDTDMELDDGLVAGILGE